MQQAFVTQKHTQPTSSSLNCWGQKRRFFCEGNGCVRREMRRRRGRVKNIYFHSLTRYFCRHRCSFALWFMCALLRHSSVLFFHSLARYYACCVGGAGKFVKNWKLNLKALRIHSMWKCWMFMFFGSNALACSAVHFALIITFFSHFPHLFSLEHRREIYIHFDSHTHHSSPSCSAEELYMMNGINKRN